MTADQVRRAMERMDALSAEGVVHLYLQREACCDPLAFINEAVPVYAQKLVENGLPPIEPVCQMLGAEFLRGLAVGIQAARMEAEEA